MRPVGLILMGLLGACVASSPREPVFWWFDDGAIMSSVGQCSKTKIGEGVSATAAHCRYMIPESIVISGGTDYGSRDDFLFLRDPAALGVTRSLRCAWPQAGEKLRIEGRVRGAVRRRIARALPRGTAPYGVVSGSLVLDQPIERGMSGGQITDDQGRLVSIVAASDGRRTFAPDPERFCLAARAAVERRRATR